MQDESIIALYWQRDEAAITHTVAKYGGFCHGVAMNILRSREDSEECVSDTWRRAWDTMPPQRPGSLMAYLGRIVRNLSLDRYRRAHAQKRFGGMEELLSELADCAPSPIGVEQAVEASRLAYAISDWLMTLSPEDRALFTRRYWYGEALNGLAGECGCTPARLAQRMRKLRLALKQNLEREDFEL